MVHVYFTWAKVSNGKMERSELTHLQEEVYLISLLEMTKARVMKGLKYRTLEEMFHGSSSPFPLTVSSLS